MREQDRDAFVEALIVIFETYRLPMPSDDVLEKRWWAALSPYPAEMVADAFDAFINESRYPPVPADIVTRCAACGALDSRPGVEEAWSLALGAMDENETVVLNNEIAASMAAAKQTFAHGDEVGARLIFKEVYAKEVAQARANGLPCFWFPSFGDDKTRRRPALEKAVAARLLPASCLEALPAPRTNALLIEAPAANSTLARESIAQMHEYIDSRKALPGQREGTAEWAFLMILRGETKSGHPLPHEMRHHANDAIRSEAGAKVIANCQDPVLKAQYIEIREETFGNKGGYPRIGSVEELKALIRKKAESAGVSDEGYSELEPQQYDDEGNPL